MISLLRIRIDMMYHVGYVAQKTVHIDFEAAAIVQRIVFW
jgi:hypothetical protein